MQRNNGEYEEYEDVYERLYRENINKDTKNLGTRDMKECTFAPKVNPISNLLVIGMSKEYLILLLFIVKIFSKIFIN